MGIRRKVVALVACLAVVATACGNNEAQTDTGAAFDAQKYFAGKTIRVIIQQTAGGGTDIQGRLIANELVKYIPGNPRVAVTNIPGKGGLEDVYDAKADDLVFGVASQASEIYTAPLTEQADLEPDKLQFIGAMGEEERAVIGYGDAAAAFPSIKDAFGKGSPVLINAASVGGPGDIFNEMFFLPWLCDNMKMGCKFISIADDGSADLDIMIQRGEMNWDAAPLTVAFRNSLDDIRAGKTRVFFTLYKDTGMKTIWPDDVTPAPVLKDLIPADLYTEFENMLPMVSSGGFGKNFFAGPDMSPEVIDVMRQAFDKVAADQAVMDKLAQLVSGKGQALIEAHAMSGQQTQDTFAKTTKLFNDQLPTYQKMQEQFYSEYWSRA